MIDAAIACNNAFAKISQAKRQRDHIRDKHDAAAKEAEAARTRYKQAPRGKRRACQQEYSAARRYQREVEKELKKADHSYDRAVDQLTKPMPLFE